MLDSGVGVLEPSNLYAGLRQRPLMAAQQRSRPGAAEQSGTDPVEPALALAAAQIPRRAMGTAGRRPACSSRSSTVQVAIITSSCGRNGCSALRNCGRNAAKNRMSFGLLAPSMKARPNSARKRGTACGLRHFGAVGRLARLLPALPGEVEQVQRADDFQGAEQLFRRQQQGAQAPAPKHSAGRSRRITPPRNAG